MVTILNGIRMATFGGARKRFFGINVNICIEFESYP